jgi:ABC-type hemin transport system substrate-binding protein
MTLRVVDDWARTIELADTPRRIVSLVPSISELVCVLGAAERLVGVTRYCTQPSEALRHCARVGGTKDPDCESVLRLHPDVVLVSPEENRRVDFDRLCAAGTQIFVVAPASVAAVGVTVDRLGSLLDARVAAVSLREAITAARWRALEGVARRVSVFCPIWRDPWMSFNRGTYAHDVLQCAGGDNVCAEAADAYGQVDLDEIAARAPEVILLPDEPYHFAQNDAVALRCLVDTPAWRNARIHLVDGRDLFWYGARTPVALERLAAILRARG